MNMQQSCMFIFGDFFNFAFVLKAMKQVTQPEWLDLGYGSEADVAENLAEMWRINRSLGGLGALTRHLYPRLLPCKKNDSPAPDAGAGVSRFPSQNLITIADLGTGSADIPVALACWARTHHRELRIFGVDWAARNLAVASRRVNRTSEVGLLRADAGRLPFTAGSVDFIISSLFLHHLSPQGVVEILQSAFAAARRGIVMSDLVRGWLPLFAFKLVQPVFARNFLTRQDGARSIRRAYTPAELRQLARAAGLPNAKVQAHWPWRMTLVADKLPMERNPENSR